MFLTAVRRYRASDAIAWNVISDIVYTYILLYSYIYPSVAVWALVCLAPFDRKTAVAAFFQASRPQ